MTRPEFVWIFSENHRVYTKPPEGSGRIWGDLIWREHWRKTPITGETSRSWLTNTGRKIPKKDADGRLFLFNEADIDRAEWIKDNRHRIGRTVENITDYTTLAQIAALIGYQENSK